MAKIKITVRPNGPLRVEDPERLMELVDVDGNPYPLDLGKPAIALCRCGASANKPFCDGQHAKIGFLGASCAVPAVEKK